MHYQAVPYDEVKIVSCTESAIYDLVLDLRKDSQIYCQWVATNLSYENFKMMYIPKGCAHGFQTLEDNTMVYNQMTEFFHPECARGIRWDDPAIGIVWPIPVRIIIEKDQKYPDYEHMAFWGHCRRLEKSVLKGIYYELG
jgi:dTDP-4-dehydrorhamnose 3,5-epimerase